MSMTVIAIEEHWTTAGITRALEAQSGQARDDSVALNDRGDIQARLEDIDAGRIEAMDAAGIDMQILSIAPPGTQGLPVAEAVALSREANDRAADAVRRYPTRLRALMTLPTPNPDAAVAELERHAGTLGHVGIMSYGRSGERPLDDPAFDELLAAAARLRQPIFIHPQIPPLAVRDASYRGFDPVSDLALATFGWGWHIEAGTAALRLILRGTFDRHPDLQIILGHWGEMLLFALDRIESLSNVATHLDRRVADYVRSNVNIATSGMLTPHLLRHALDFTTVDRILLSGDYPFHVLNSAAIGEFLSTLSDSVDQQKIASRNAETLFGLPHGELDPLIPAGLRARS
jgi:predicted TIM-barrel fold metal-dependent hydrolase